MTERLVAEHIKADLEGHKMVLLSGPRQCGKTTLAKALFPPSETAYYNWDVLEHRKKLRAYAFDLSKPFWIFDEIHKFRQWRNWLKGVFDLHHSEHKILVTGSARLDQYARGGDSLQGRYFAFRLHPFTLTEVLELDGRVVTGRTGKATQLERDYRKLPEVAFKQVPNDKAQELLLQLYNRGGFPEPFLSTSTSFAGRWRLAYGQRLINEEVRTLEQTQELEQMALLYDRLPDLISNNLSVNNLARDLEVAHQTVAKWILIFEKLYANFYVSPYGEPTIRAVKRDRKLYLWDWARIEDPGARLENLVAVHLLRFVHWFEDVYGERLELRFVKDVDGHEIDFVILRKRKPWIAVEVKSSQDELSSGMKYILERIKIPFAYQIHLKSQEVIKHPKINTSQIYSIPVSSFLSALP